MDNLVIKNPFTPVFGKVPCVLAGRDELLTRLLFTLDSNSSNPDICSLITGVRGSGKTTLLEYLKFRAEEKGWIVASVSSSKGMLDDIVQRTIEFANHLTKDTPSKKLTGLKISGFGISWENSEGMKPNFRTQITTLLDTLADTDTGLLFIVDEVNSEDSEMVQLTTVFQHLIRENRKVALFMAGLPYHVSSLLTGKTTSFLRRAAQFHLTTLDDYDVKQAFRLTVKEGNKSIEESALDVAVEKISGFPFMLQLVGYRAWIASGKSDTIKKNHVVEGAEVAKEELKSRIFASTISELSKGDLEFIAAMNKNEIQTTRKEIAKRTGRNASWISKYKKRLLTSGVVEETLFGDLKFALPGFSEYLMELGV